VSKKYESTHTSTYYISGWWLTYPSEKYESQMGSLFPSVWQNKIMFQTNNQLSMVILHCYVKLPEGTGKNCGVFTSII
jgi:hypothetical protein